MAYPSDMLPYSQEVVEHLLAQARAGDVSAGSELERLHEPVVAGVVDEFYGLLPLEQLDVCCRFALDRALKAYGTDDASEGLTLADLARDWMRLEVEETIRHQHWMR